VPRAIVIDICRSQIGKEFSYLVIFLTLKLDLVWDYVTSSEYLLDIPVLSEYPLRSNFLIVVDDSLEYTTCCTYKAMGSQISVLINEDNSPRDGIEMLLLRTVGGCIP
jgi:hypothetical protein